MGDQTDAKVGGAFTTRLLFVAWAHCGAELLVTPGSR
jgi:hypothetical protein